MRKHHTTDAQALLSSENAVAEPGLSTSPPKPGSDYCRKFDLNDARRNPSKKKPAVHQQDALSKLHAWFESAAHVPQAGGIVVLPTGGGKTFTAARFLCHGPLSRGYKVLWLAHTHHLLDQAYQSFAPIDASEANRQGVEIGQIAEPKDTLTMRVVSGTPEHCPVSTVKRSDDILIITLQTLRRAWEHRQQLTGLSDFFASAGEKLFVVFDEAHHAPAPGYRSLINDLRKHHRKMSLLGLTATPTYADVHRKGWLKQLFPQEIIYQVSATKLIAAGVLAKPIFEKTNTNFTPSFNQRDFEKWIGTYRDLPENVIDNLARNQERNTLIAEAYVKNRKKYGKTIIFAERWHQCEFLCEVLRRRGVRAGAVYSHVDMSESTATGRNIRAKGHNSTVLESFKKGELDVIVNVKMLTEGTDVPSVNTVFLTRETTSRILATQMVGRALRGPKFGGTEIAYIVSFTDNWQHRINFADYSQLEPGSTSEDVTEYAKRPPLGLISISLVRSLSRNMDSGIAVTPGPFLSLMPIGWYRTQYDSLVDDTDDTETIRDLVMVFDDSKRSFESFIRHLKKVDLAAFASERLTLIEVKQDLEEWASRFFHDTASCRHEELLKSLLDIARHMAQNDGTVPEFILFEERAGHDLDVVARTFITRDLKLSEAQQALHTEYLRTDRYWPALYANFDRFKFHVDGCVNRFMLPPSTPERLAPPEREVLPEREPTDDVKLQVKRRDGFTCLCCGESDRRLLQIDHVAPSYIGGDNSLGNLQTLCKRCNSTKGINTINFRIQHNQCLKTGPATFPEFDMPTGQAAKEALQWKRYLQRTINSYYQGSAVSNIHIGSRGRDFYEWKIELWDGNDPAWLAPYLKQLVSRIRDQIGLARNDGFVMQRLLVSAPNRKAVAWPLRSKL
jgi:superfamily II DNA or RNA helicase